MDNALSLLPGRNPSGSNHADYAILPGTGSTSGANPILPPINLPAGAPQTNPYAAGSVVPTFGANGGPYQTTNLTAGGTGAPVGGGGTPGPFPGGIGGMSGMTNKDVSRMFGDLKKTYGDGIAHAIMDFLSSGAGFNQKAIDNLFAALQPGINRGTENLMEQFSTSGNRFGSGAQIGLADYLSQVQLNEGQLETQMYEKSISDYMNVLMGVGDKNATRKANSPGIMDQISSILGLVGTGAGALGAAGVGAGGGVAGGVIAGLSAL